jgi:hypothetical protein
MTNSNSMSPLEKELGAMFRAEEPPRHVSERIDDRFSAALERRSIVRRSSRRVILLVAAVSVGLLGFAGGVVAQQFAAGCGINLLDGVEFNDCVEARPGLTSEGGPFENSDILDRPPDEAAAMAAEKGYSIRWQIEDRLGTKSFDDDVMRFSEAPPPCGVIESGAVVGNDRIQMVVTLNDPTRPESEC